MALDDEIEIRRSSLDGREPASFNDLLYRVLETSGEERERILDGCGDAELRARVRRLLEDEKDLASFLDPGTGERSITAFFHAIYELSRFDRVTAFGPYVLA